MAGSSSEYVYLRIEDAKKSVNVKVNLFVKVSEIGIARQSRGTDYIVTLKVIDFSCPAPGIPVNFFAENMKNLPNVKSVGDIISLHHVEMKIHNGEFYCLFNKRSSSFALYSGNNKMSCRPYQTSTKYLATDHDDELLLQLRILSLEQKSNSVRTKYVSLLRSIEIGKVFDIICKVLYVHETSEGEWMLYVWDGTDSPPVAFQMDLDMEKEKPSPLHLEALPLSRDILCTFPREGTVLRITANNSFEDIRHLQGADCWVKLCNIACELQSGLWKGVTKPSSKVFILSDEDDDVKYRKRIHDERRKSKIERMPLTSFPEPSHITETDYEHLIYATLMDSITHPQVTHGFKCVVRVVASCPWRGEDLHSPVDGHYRIRLTLEDPTARIHAYIYGKDGVKFFGGNPTPYELTRKMNKLLGIEDYDSSKSPPASRNPPWVWCCLRSYYLNKSDPWGSRRYRIVATKLVA